VKRAPKIIAMNIMIAYLKSIFFIKKQLRVN